MRIIQIVTTISYGDAVSNDVRAIKQILLEEGYQTEIYAENIAPRLPEGTAKRLDKMPSLTDEDIILYHLSIGTPLNYKLKDYKGKKVVIYHNITPPEFFEEYSSELVKNTNAGLDGARFLANVADYGIADSTYNAEDMRRMGYQCPIEVCPILIPFSDYDKSPDQNVIEQYRNDGYTNLLFVGRIAPNKRQENVIRAFYHYHKYYNPKSRLFLVGNWNGMEMYYRRLTEYVEELGLSDYVIFPGHIKFAEILSYYHLADAFVCMSEHEGFCVPLVEAMHFQIPVIAYDTSAIASTLGGSGVLLDDNSPEFVSAVINRVVQDQALRTQLVCDQNRRLNDFQYEHVKKQLLTYISTLRG